MARKNRRRRWRRDLYRLQAWLSRQKQAVINRRSSHDRKHRPLIPAYLRVKVWARDGSCCQRCHLPYSEERIPTIHHINGNPADNRLHETDRTSPENNLVGWCEPCQKEHHGKEPRKHRKGLPPTSGSSEPNSTSP